MKPDNSNLADRESRLEEAVLSYYEALDEGRVPDCEELLALHPDLAAELKEFFADTVTVSPLLRDSATEASRSEPIPDCLGSYRLVEMIGQGAQAEVYRALHLTINKTVALKLIRGGQLASPSELQRFRNDAAILAELDHPNIVPAYDIQEEGGQIYFIMKFIEGGNLENQLGQFPAQPRAGAKLMIAIARAVHHAHQGGILHRDLKPRNILLDRDGQPYVTDFGLAKRLLTEAGPDAVEESATRKKPIGSASTLDGGILGTALWMAPEAASGKKKNITTASDVYGLGAIFYALLTGQPPFIGETLLDILAKVKEVKPVPPRTRNHRVDRDLDAICLKCLEKEAKKRYGSAEALALDLERYLEGKPVHARPIGTVPRTWKWMKRRPALAGLLAVSAAAILTMLVGSLLFTQKLSVALSDSRAKEEVARHHLFNLQLHRVADIWKRDPHLARLLLEDRDSCPV
ncbi:MAG TPA: serine/threonine-protein kinase, partial [Gemmataceae bacterium]|nr:serine/threonine-protein kinase [Gemmataceae bacterium]